jgi:hypothetical protein
MAASVWLHFEGTGQLGQNLADDAISFGEEPFSFLCRRDQPCQLFGNRHQVIAGHDDRFANREPVFISRQDVSAPLVELDLPLFAFPANDVQLFLVGLGSDLLRQFGLWGSFAALFRLSLANGDDVVAVVLADIRFQSGSNQSCLVHNDRACPVSVFPETGRHHEPIGQPELTCQS